jgi:hypothetical protein
MKRGSPRDTCDEPSGLGSTEYARVREASIGRVEPHRCVQVQSAHIHGRSALKIQVGPVEIEARCDCGRYASRRRPKTHKDREARRRYAEAVQVHRQKPRLSQLHPSQGRNVIVAERFAMMKLSPGGVVGLHTPFPEGSRCLALKPVKRVENWTTRSAQGQRDARTVPTHDQDVAYPLPRTAGRDTTAGLAGPVAVYAAPVSHFGACRFS